MIALTRRRTWASRTPNPWTASGVQSRKCDIQPVRYRLTPSMQEVSDRPQVGGVISRIFRSEDAQSLDRFRCTKPKVRYPTRQVSADAFHAGSKRSPPVRRRHLPHFRPQPPLRLAGRKDGDFVAALPPSAAKAEAQELNLVGSAYATFLLVDREPHARLQKSSDRCHDALPGALAAHEDVAIIRVTNEPETPPRQFTIQFVEHDVWRERTSLRRSFLD